MSVQCEDCGLFVDQESAVESPSLDDEDAWLWTCLVCVSASDAEMDRIRALTPEQLDAELMTLGYTKAELDAFQARIQLLIHASMRGACRATGGSA